MKNLYKRVLSFGLTLLMILSCTTPTAFAADAVSGTDVAVWSGSSTATAKDTIMPRAVSRVSFGTISGGFNSSSKPSTSGKIPSWPLWQKYAPYVHVSPGSQTFAFYVDIYKDNSFLYSATFNITNGQPSGRLRIGGDNLTLGSGNYEFRVGFNTNITNVSLNFYADPV